MNLLDGLIVIVVVGGMVGGYRLGFVTRVVSWVGLAIGLYAAIRLLPWLLAQMPNAGSDRVFLVTVGLVIGLSFLGQAAGFAVGSKLRPKQASSALTRVDQVFGSAVGAVGVVALVWLLLPVAAQTRGAVASQVANSAIAQFLDDHLPDAPDSMQALQSAAGDGFPRVFDALRPTPELGSPPGSSGLSPQLEQTVARSILKVEGVACNRIQDGSGFVVADGLVMTNAHVVSGEKATELERDDGSRVKGEVVYFDPVVDLAIVRAPKLARPALPLGESNIGDTGGVFGHPGGEPLRVAPFKTARLIRAIGRDIYGTGPSERDVLELASSLRQGDSGSALVSTTGSVVGVAFAIAPDQPNVAYALTTGEVREALQANLSVPVSTGPCTK